MKRFIFILFIAGFLLSGCTTTRSIQAVATEEVKKDNKAVEISSADKAKEESAPKGKDEKGVQPAVVQEEPEIILEKYIIVEKPVFLEEDSGTNTKQLTPEDYANRMTEKEKGGIMEYDYIPTQTYPIFTQPMRITDICLQPGEFFEENSVVMGESSKWMLESGLSNSNGIKQQHVYLKPLEAGLETTLIINTTQRIYRILLKSYKTKYMSVVQFRYRLGKMGGQFVDMKTAAGGGVSYNEIDRYDFGYKVTYTKGKKPKWLPTVVMNDGVKTYIYLPKEVINNEIPGVFENTSDIINYRLKDNMFVIDKIADKLTLKYKGQSITITKL
jgi:P-type conjugative transfer protein TrbG